MWSDQNKEKREPSDLALHRRPDDPPIRLGPGDTTEFSKEPRPPAWGTNLNDTAERDPAILTTNP